MDLALTFKSRDICFERQESMAQSVNGFQWSKDVEVTFKLWLKGTSLSNWKPGGTKCRLSIMRLKGCLRLLKPYHSGSVDAIIHAALNPNKMD